MLRYSFLCMIISYARLRALSCILPLPSGAYLVCLACLSKSSALSKMGHLRALTFTPVIVMTFEFCQRGATVDTPFLTVLKTWTSPFEHPVIIHVCVRLEFPEVSACTPCLRISRLDCLVSGFAPNTCALPWRGKECLVRHPHTSPAMARGHRLVFCCHRQCILPVGIICCRSALHFVKMAILRSRLLFICFCRYFNTAVWHFVPLHTRVGRDGLLVSLPCKLYKIGSSIRGAPLSLA